MFKTPIGIARTIVVSSLVAVPAAAQGQTPSFEVSDLGLIAAVGQSAAVAPPAGCMGGVIYGTVAETPHRNAVYILSPLPRKKLDDYGQVYGCNSDYVAVGLSGDTAAVWADGWGHVQTLPGGSYNGGITPRSFASDVNKARQVVGYTKYDTGFIAVLWTTSYDKNIPVQQPYTLAVNARATSINDNSQVVGECNLDVYGAGGIPCYFSAASPPVVTAISTSPGFANAINDNGIVVGHLDRPTGRIGFSWHLGAKLTSLYPINYPGTVTRPAYAHAEALAVSPNGYIAGTSYNGTIAAPVGHHATVWYGTTAYDLNTTIGTQTFTLTKAAQIVPSQRKFTGEQVLCEGVDAAGKKHAYLLTRIVSLP